VAGAGQIIPFPRDSSPATTRAVLPCIRRAGVIIHARNPRSGTCCATPRVVGGSCKLLLYSVCHFHAAAIRSLLYSSNRLNAPRTNPRIYDALCDAPLSSIVLAYKFIPRLPRRLSYISVRRTFNERCRLYLVKSSFPMPGYYRETIHDH